MLNLKFRFISCNLSVIFLKENCGKYIRIKTAKCMYTTFRRIGVEDAIEG